MLIENNPLPCSILFRELRSPSCWLLSRLPPPLTTGYSACCSYFALQKLPAPEDMVSISLSLISLTDFFNMFLALPQKPDSLILVQTLLSLVTGSSSRFLCWDSRTDLSTVDQAASQEVCQLNLSTKNQGSGHGPKTAKVHEAFGQHSQAHGVTLEAIWWRARS